MNRIATAAIYLLAISIGIVTFLAPFLLPQPEVALENLSPLTTMTLLILSLVVLLVEVQGQAVSAKIVAALGILVAITSVLRFIEVAIPGPGGFSPIFVPIILAGYVFGARFGFLLGTMTLLVSALITGGVGPWLPYQMFTAGWVGLSSGWLPHPSRPQGELLLLLGWSFAWGILFGFIINLYSWPFVLGAAATSWQPGIGLGETVSRYGAFYLATSLLWDLGRAVGNVALIIILGIPAIRALSRFRDRFHFEIVSEPQVVNRNP
jgi:energy-coupling factor transport system substrate-specific component